LHLSATARGPGRADKAEAEAARVTIVVGLLGGIAGGKSTVAKLLAERGAAVLDADALAHRELEREEVRARIVRELGPEVLAADGRTIDRRALGERVFADRAALARLEAIVHPGVLAAFERALAAREGAPVLVFDAPLLVEAGALGRCDEVLFVDASREAREARARARGWAPGEIERREARQLPLAEKRARASFVLRNDGDLGEAAAEVARFWQERIAPRLAPGIDH
jgi:dephospho-CoA kinase